MELEIRRMDTDLDVFSTTDFANPNNFTLYFDYSTLNNVSNSTLFRITSTRTTNDAEITSRKYFDINAKIGWLSSGIVFFIALLMIIFGMTFTVAKLAFSWFGIFVLLASLAVTSFAVTTWYITFLQVISVIVLVYSVIIMWTQNYATVT